MNNDELLKLNIDYKDDIAPLAVGGKLMTVDIKNNLFIMNNHRWAFYCWQKYLPKKSDKIRVVHIDRHPDACPICKGGIDDFLSNDNLTYITNKYLQWDNFIDAFAVKNNNNVEIYSLVHSSELSNCFVDEKFDNFNYDNEKEFFECINRVEYFDIVDIDLDYFLDINIEETEYNLWSEIRINDFMKSLCNVIDMPKIITISTSPSCFGNNNENDDIKLKKSNDLLSIVEKNLKENDWII